MPAREGCACNPPASVILREGRGSRRHDPEKAPPPGMGSGGGSVCAADSGVRRARHRSRPGGRSDRAPRPKPGLLATHRCPNGTPAGGTPAPEPLTGLCSRSRREPSLHPTGENRAANVRGAAKSRIQASRPKGRYVVMRRGSYPRPPPAYRLAQTYRSAVARRHCELRTLAATATSLVEVPPPTDVIRMARASRDTYPRNDVTRCGTYTGWRRPWRDPRPREEPT